MSGRVKLLSTIDRRREARMAFLSLSSTLVNVLVEYAVLAS